jgi:hypothetical protein
MPCFCSRYCSDGVFAAQQRPRAEIRGHDVGSVVKRYRNRLQDAQAMLRVSEEMEFIYPELAAEFYTVVLQVKAGQERARV